MADEAIANLTCALAASELANNTILIISGDNGGEVHDDSNSVFLQGNNYPLKGYKGMYYRGGVSNTALIHSPLLPSSSRGSTYSGLVHITGTI